MNTNLICVFVSIDTLFCHGFSWIVLIFTDLYPENRPQTLSYGKMCYFSPLVKGDEMLLLTYKMSILLYSKMPDSEAFFPFLT